MAIFRFILLELILARHQLADLPLPCRGIQWLQNGNFQIATVRVHIGRSTGRSTPPIEASSGQNGNFQIATVRVSYWQIQWLTGRSAPFRTCRGIQWSGMAILDLYCQSSYWQINWQIYPPQRHLVAKNGNFQIATVRVHIGRSTGRSTPPIEASSGQEWQFLDCYCQSTYWQINWQIYPSHRGIQWSGMAILDLYCQSSYWPTRHLVVKNGNFRFILLELILANWPPLPQRHLVVKNGNFQIYTVRVHIGPQINWQIYPSHRGIQWSGMAIFRFILLEFILANQLADQEASSGQEW